MHDDYNLQRFLAAQKPVIDTVRSELRAGRKQTHWMWFIFPQIEGLGRSRTARTYAISSAAEASAYLAHPVLGRRLVECCGLVIAIEGLTAREIFGSIDALKLRSSVTLFASVSDNLIFREVLSKYYDGEPDPTTLKLLGKTSV